MNKTNHINILKKISLITESTDNNTILESYVELAKNDSLLIVENDLYKNLKTYKIQNPIIASNYVLTKIKTLDRFNENDFKKLHESLDKFMTQHQIETSNIDVIDESISNIICESIVVDKNIELLYESISNVVDHITKSNDVKQKIDKFNEKYKFKGEDISIIKTLSESKTDKKQLLESLKEETINLIKSDNSSNTDSIINETIEKINGITFDDNTINESIIDLYELKENLLS